VRLAATTTHPPRAAAAAAAACPRAVASETMGRTKQKPKAHAKIKKYKRSRDTKRRDRDVDQVFDDIKRAEALGPQVIPFDDDLPGGGQFYCARPAASGAPLPARARATAAPAGRDGQALRGPEGPRRPQEVARLQAPRQGTQGGHEVLADGGGGRRGHVRRGPPEDARRPRGRGRGGAAGATNAHGGVGFR